MVIVFTISALTLDVGVVLGQDGQQVLVKHGSIYCRVHPCRLSLQRGSVATGKKGNNETGSLPLEKVVLTESDSDVDEPIIGNNSTEQTQQQDEEVDRGNVIDNNSNNSTINNKPQPEDINQVY